MKEVIKNFLKKNKSAIIMICIALVAIGGLAYAIYRVANIKEPEIIIVDNNLTQYKGASTEVAIEDEVTTIGFRAFEGKTKITKISFGENSKLDTIGFEAFLGCSGLVDIVLPKGLTHISTGAFKDCSALVNIVIPEGVIEIEKGAFEGCKNLKSISLPSTLKTLGDGVFTNCTSLETITSKSEKYPVENGILYAENKTVLVKYLASNTATYYEVPASVKEIKPYAFQGATSLVEIVIPTTVKEIGKAALNGCTSLETVSVPFVGATEKQHGTFAYFFGAVPTSVTTVNVLGGTVIDTIAFRNCSKIVVINLPDTLTTIGVDAFKGCSKLLYINIPVNVKHMSSSVFVNCNKGLEITVNATKANIQHWEENWNAGGYTVVYANE